MSIWYHFYDFNFCTRVIFSALNEHVLIFCVRFNGLLNFEVIYLKLEKTQRKFILHLIFQVTETSFVIQVNGDPEAECKISQVNNLFKCSAQDSDLEYFLSWIEHSDKKTKLFYYI